MELLESLGINGRLFLAQIINFVILIFLLRKFLYRPVINMLEERRAKIDQGLKDAEESANKLTEVEKDTAAIRENAYAEAKKIKTDAKATAEKEAGTIVSKAGIQANNIIKVAENEAKNIKEKAYTEARAEIANLVTLAVEKIVGAELDQRQKERMTSIAIKEF